MPATLYGIKNCNTMKEARSKLEAHGIAHDFYDYKAASIDQAHLKVWVKELRWEAVLNRAGTTLRLLPEADKQKPIAEKEVALMQAQPSMIKRPIVDFGKTRLAGFKSDAYAKTFADSASRWASMRLSPTRRPTSFSTHEKFQFTGSGRDAMR
jgi:arsenate reductase